MHNNKNLDQIYLNTNIQISLKKLNLSYSSLDSYSLYNFIKNNSGFINLKILNISNNSICDKLFDVYVSDNLIHLLENLEELNISHNRITTDSCKNIEHIIQNQKKIKEIKFNKNPIENFFSEYILDVGKHANVKSHSSSQDPFHKSNSLTELKHTNRVNEEDEAFSHFLDNLMEIHSRKEFKLGFSKILESTNTISLHSHNPHSVKVDKILHKIILFCD
jgi:hypothetical protein